MTSLLADELRNAISKLRTTSMPLADLIPLLQQAADALDSRAAESADAGHWVPWKTGDALPEYGEYLVTMQDTETHADGRSYVSTWTAMWKPISWVHSPERRAIAYWSRPLPPPYVARQSGTEAGEEGE